jgi:hypothetical protein
VSEVVQFMDTGKASKLAGGLLAITGVLGIIILASDQILRESLGGQHWYGLIAFVVIDFVVTAYLVVKPSGTSLMFSAVWSIIRIAIQIADVATAPMSQMTYGDFANYLFNPTLVTSPNPPGVPAALIDLILLLELVVVGVAFSGRHRTPKAT